MERRDEDLSRRFFARLKNILTTTAKKQSIGEEFQAAEQRWVHAR